jgi:hypothetical protein
MISGSWPPDYQGPIVIRGYQGRRYEDLIASFYSDAALLLKEGYEPSGQHYVEGRWTIWRVLAGFILAPLLIGFVVLAHVIAERPIGTLTVTYVKRPPR